MIEFTAQDGQKVAVNPDLVWHIRPSGAGQTVIYAPTGTALFVQEPYGAVRDRLNDAVFGSD